MIIRLNVSSTREEDVLPKSASTVSQYPELVGALDVGLAPAGSGSFSEKGPAKKA